jgi:hypothetical protein
MSPLPKRCETCGKTASHWYSFSKTCWACYKRQAEADERTIPVMVFIPVVEPVEPAGPLIQQPEEPAP